MTTPDLPLKAPSARATAFWDAVLGEYDLTPSDTEITLSICRVLSVIDRLQEAIDNAPSLITQGSHGEKPIPALTEQRAQLTLLDRLLARLSFDVEDGPASRLLP